MATNDERRGNDPRMDPATMYLEEVFTDRRIGTIRRLTPVKPDATTDVARPVVYVGETQVMTQVGTLPIVFEIPAATLEDAAKQFGNLAKETNTLILPSNMSDIAGMIAAAMNVIRHGDVTNGAGGAGSGGAPARDMKSVTPPKPE